MKLIIFLTTVLFLNSSQAMYGQVNTSDVPENFCRLLIYKADDTLRTICSGTLISSTEVATAGHCVAPMQEAGNRMQVDCGYKSRNGYKMKIELTQKGTKVFTEGVYFKESQTASVFYINPTYWTEPTGDTGRVILPQPSALTVSKVLSSEDLFRYGREAALQYAPTFQNCRVGGYGVTQGEVAGYPLIGEYGEIYFMDGALLKLIDIQAVPEEQKIPFSKAANSSNPVRALSWFLADNGYIPASIDAGDSGSGMICEVDGEWQLVGVATDYKLETAPGAYFLNYKQMWMPFDREKTTQLVVPNSP